MKKSALFILLFCLSALAIDSIFSNLEARPGGGSSYRSSSSGSSRSSSSSYRSSSSSSYRSSGSSYSGGGGGGGELSPEAGFAIGAIIALIFALITFFSGFPENPMKLKEWASMNIILFLFSTGLIALTSFFLLRSGALLNIFAFFFFVFPFVLVFYSFKKLFGTRETIYIAKGKA